jgi:monoamine oxidase
MARSHLIPLFARALRQIRSSRASGIPLNELVELEAERARSRRAFLRGAAGIGAALALPGLAQAGDTVAALASWRRAPVIAIVGGGTAGLHCAYRLKQQGLAATVYEATGRTGGRMFSDRSTFGYAQQACELGGELIDTGHVTMRALAKEFGLKLEDSSKDSPKLTDLVGNFGGRNVPYAELLAAFKPIAAAIDASLATLTVPDNGISWADPNGGEWLDRLSLNQWFDQRRITGVGRDLLTVAHVIEWGLDADVMNAYDMLGLISTNTKKIELFGDSDERFHIAGGNDQIPTALAAGIPGQIKTGYVLERLATRSDGRYVLSFRSNGASSEVIADHVVSAIPFKLLRDVDLKLDLPDLKKTAIKELGYGQNSKTMTGYSSRPWRAQGSNGESFSDQPYQNCWDTAHMQPGSHGILTEYTGGTPALTAGNSGTTASHAADFVRQIDRVYPGSAAVYTGSAVRMAWHKMPYNKASYSAYLVGQYTKFAGTEGDRVGNLHFAGEHTDFDNQGYMEGAANSGQRVADEIMADVRSCASAAS